MDSDNDGRRVRITLNPDTHAALEQYAREHGVTVDEAARRILITKLMDPPDTDPGR